MRTYHLAVLCLILSVAAQAQSNYKPGYIVKSAGDTVRGFINYREWNNTPRSVEFKNAANSAHTTQYTAATLSGFAVEGMVKYISYKGTISMDKTVFPDLPSALDTTVKIDTVFLQMIYEGKPLSLLKHEDFKTRLFIMDTGHEPTELRYYQYYANGNSSVQTVNLYANELRSLGQKYNIQDPKFLRKIDLSRYDESDIQQIIQRIDHDDRKAGMSTFGSRLFAGLAANCISTQFTGQSTFSGKASRSYGPRVSLGFDVFPNKFTQRLYMKAELAFTMNSPTFERASTYDSYKYKFKSSNIAIIPQAIFNVYNTDNVKVHLGGGVSFNYSFYGRSESNYTIYNSLTGTSNLNTYKLESYWASLLFRAGVTLHKRIEAFAIYMPNASYTRYINFSITSSSYGAGVYYLFGK